MYVYVWVYRFFLSVQTYCIMTLDVCTSEYLQSVLHQSILILPRFVTQLPCVSWGDTLRRWDDQNGPTFLSLHRGGGVHTFCKVFLETLLNHFHPDWFLGTCKPHIVSCVCNCCVCLLCVPLLHSHLKYYKRLWRKMTGIELLQWVQRSISAVCFPSSEPLHLEKHTEKTAYWLAQVHKAI